jgi:hypothetical protein
VDANIVVRILWVLVFTVAALVVIATGLWVYVRSGGKLPDSYRNESSWQSALAVGFISSVGLNILWAITGWQTLGGFRSVIAVIILTITIFAGNRLGYIIFRQVKFQGCGAVVGSIVGIGIGTGLIDLLLKASVK